MATQKYREHVKTDSGYDVVHRESQADLIVTDDGGNVQQHIDHNIYSTTGAHGFRYNGTDEVFEIYNNETGEWEEVSAGGGGLAPLDVSGITVLTANGKVYFKWSDPDDTEIDGTVICVWAGTKLVRKAGSYPTSAKDGTVILDNTTRNAYQNTYFCDSGLSNGTTYYYQFFPYSTDRVVNTNEANRKTATPNKANVGNVSGISATGLNGRVQLKWTDPAASVVSDGITLANWAGTKVVYKTGGYPTSEEDGTLVLNSTTRNAYSSTALEVTGLTNGTTYYFAFFPYSDEGAVTTNASNRITAVPNKITISTEPSQSGTLTYTGSSQSPTWSNYNSAQLTIGGVTSETGAGTYSATFTPTDDYCWSDGSTTAKTVTWKINKAAGSLSISPTTLTLNPSNLTGKITVTRAGDGAITATSSDTSIATVSVSGTTVTVNNVNKTSGTATITIKVAAGTNHNAPSNKTCAVTASFVSTTLNDNDWSVISDVSAESNGANYWAVGDTKSVLINGTIGTLSLNATYWVYILGFNHNSTREGSGIHFGGFKTAQTNGVDICLCDSAYNTNAGTGGTKAFAMNHWGSSSSPYNTNYGGWKGCDARYDILGSTKTAPSGYGSMATTSRVGYDAPTDTATSPVANTLMAALPSALRAVMKPITKYTDNKGNSSNTSGNVTSSVDYLPLLAEFEIYGSRSYANQYEQNYQAQYDYYKAGNSKVKYKHNGTTTTAIWWERSPYYNNAYSFCGVNADGSADFHYSRLSFGLAPAFMV